MKVNNNELKGTQQIWQFWKWYPGLIRTYSYPMTRPVIKVALGRIEIFYHYKISQTGSNQKWCNLKSSLSKILNSRTIPEQAWKSGFFKYISSTPPKKTIQGIQGTPETLGTLKHYLWMELHASPSFFLPLNPPPPN